MFSIPSTCSVRSSASILIVALMLASGCDDADFDLGSIDGSVFSDGGEDGGSDDGGKDPGKKDPDPDPDRIEIALRVESRTAAGPGDIAVANFAREALDLLNDSRGWSKAGYEFIEDENADRILVVAEPDEVMRICFISDPFVSCRRRAIAGDPFDYIAINANRWREGTSFWDECNRSVQDCLVDYRPYVLNHEMGHSLGLRFNGAIHPSPRCPVAGQAAAVMAQQTLGLEGCLPNGWPLDWEVDIAIDMLSPMSLMFTSGFNMHDVIVE